MNAELVGKIEALGFLTCEQRGAHDAVAVRYRRPEHGGVWGVLVWQAGQLVFSWVVTPDGFREIGVQGLLPLLEGPEAAAEYAARRKAANDKAAATRWLTAILEPLITPRLVELRAWRWTGPMVVPEARDIPPRWYAGGLVCDGKRISAFLKKIEKGEARGDERDRAGG